jgi:hypothetical protein
MNSGFYFEWKKYLIKGIQYLSLSALTSIKVEILVIWYTYLEK